MIADGDAARARALLDESLAVQRRLPDPAGESSTLSKLSTLQRSLGDRQAALDSAQAALRLVESGQYPTELIEALRAGIAAQSALGRTDEALATAKRLHDLQMAALKEQRLEILADLQAACRTAPRNASGKTAPRRPDPGAEPGKSAFAAQCDLRNPRSVAGGHDRFPAHAAAPSPPVARDQRHRCAHGLTNRRAATQRLNALTVTRAQAASLTRHVLFVIDIDHFKQVNDGFGHHAGDGVLVQISRCLQSPASRKTSWPAGVARNSWSYARTSPRTRMRNG